MPGLVREIVVKILQSQGYETVEAETGPESIKRLKEDGVFDLLFTDVVLPEGMNGVEIAEESQRIQPDIKVIFTSGYAENTLILNGEVDPDVILVNKHYRRTEFLEKVRAVLGDVES